MQITGTTPIIVNGYSEYKITAWDDFGLVVSYFANELGFIFRGQRDSDWPLSTSLDRLIERIKPEIDIDSTYDFLITEFVKSIRGRTQTQKGLLAEGDELWALGQHYGLATPLLDWSKSIYVAVFFAFEDPTPSASGWRSVYALHQNSVEKILEKHNSKKYYRDKFAFVDPVTDHNPRLISQSGLFTRQPIGFNFSEWIQKNFKGQNEAPYLMKISIPDSERLNVLKHLRQMNIHHGTLFPDLHGASKYCNDTLELLSSKSKG